jgi:lipooligosaccharide transport system ATP-binding protein
VRQNLIVYARYYGITGAPARRRADELLEFVQLGEKAKDKVPQLSGGMKRRLVVARALLHEPELLILDEPTTGLDPQARHLIWQKLRALKARGTTMAITTHYMEEAAQLCDRLVIMDRGRVLAEGAPGDLTLRHVGREVVEVRAAPGEDLAGFRVDGATPERAGDTFFFFFPDRAPPLDALAAAARARGLQYLHRHATLEDVFLKLTGRELKE